MKKTLIFAMLVVLLAGSPLVTPMWGQANGPAPQNQPPGQIPLLVGGQFTNLPAAIAPGNMTPLQLDSLGNLKVNIQAGSSTGLGTAATDSTGFTSGVSPFTPGGAVFNDTLASIPQGVWATFRMTAFRGLHVNLRDSSGNEYGGVTCPQGGCNAFPVAPYIGGFPASATNPVPVSLPSNAPVNVGQISGVAIVGGAIPVVISPASGLPLQPCNPVRVTNCQHF